MLFFKEYFAAPTTTNLYLQCGMVDTSDVFSLLSFSLANLVSKIVETNAILVCTTTYLGGQTCVVKGIRGCIDRGVEGGSEKCTRVEWKGEVYSSSHDHIPDRQENSQTARGQGLCPCHRSLLDVVRHQSPDKNRRVNVGERDSSQIHLKGL